MDSSHSSLARRAFLCDQRCASFLQTLQKEGHFAIGKSYYEPISYLEFDGPSQDVINFLQGLVTDSGSKEQDFFPNAGRHLYFPPTLFEEAVELLMNLDSFLLQYSMYDFLKSIFRMSMGRKISFIFRWKTMVILRIDHY